MPRYNCLQVLGLKLQRRSVKNPSVHITGCNCHILHNATQKAIEMFVDGTNFDVEELVLLV